MGSKWDHQTGPNNPSFNTTNGGRTKAPNLKNILQGKSEPFVCPS
uniref:Uncharacterized protein n=1 Tax=Schistosoma japonicum TaxID=6182 RepID=Q5BXS9_SCHJA|nr:unknown [Schistosoma japonicum]